ncbi:chemotaxis protein CheB [Paraglaciecola sp. 25GB23A]|uniref:chemotaxis protein CheB n=1 Tax=Paraglaciecola sp. 25GB23A TaxID=3156068 RepID=UPI0032AFBD37
MSEKQDSQNFESTTVEPIVTEGETQTRVSFPIVGIGASAGGLEAFSNFFKACPADTGMAFVLVSHLAPDHHSLLTEILQRTTSMLVTQVVDHERVAPNHVYIIPPAYDMALFNGVLQLSRTELARSLHLTIDIFFRSLADAQSERAIGIILSGTASDGTMGLRAILGAGGVCIVQTPSTAKYDGMPQSAINAGYATHVLNVEDMPAMLQKLSFQSNLPIKLPPILSPNTLSSLNQILLLVRSSMGHDFSLYKKSTIGRRIERRMALNHITDIAVYARFLKQNANEVHALFNDMLINVTSFFRDADAFVMLKRDILPKLLADKPENYVFRVWVAGCSSGEEAYSIAIVLRELMDEMHIDLKVQIYATDLDDEVINTARSGSYSAGIALDVGPERLLRFFTLDGHGYKIKKNIRQMVVFAVQSIIKDPPFTKLDLLSCRNLMIYLEQEQQNRLIPIFHFALNPGGVLFLSNSESITNHHYLFKQLNRKWKFYQAQKTENTLNLTQFESIAMTNKSPQVPQKIATTKLPAISVETITNRILLQSYAPASVTTDIRGNILYVHGDISPYFFTPSGPVTTHMVDMARAGLQLPLRTALQAAMRGEVTMNKEVSINTKGGHTKAQFSVRRLTLPVSEPNNDDSLLLVSFHDVVGQSEAKRRRGKPITSSEEHLRNEQLEGDLIYARENQQATIEEMQATNEELKSANEELQSTNEELQSTNEELEMSKEELQSLNEETITVNNELSNKVEQLSMSQNDLKNLMDNITTGIVFMDYELNIRSFTREAVKAYRLIATDVGRPLGDITSNLQEGNLLAELNTVLKTLVPQEIEVQTHGGVYYLARIQPYRTMDNAIEGLVISLTDIDILRKTTIKLAELELVQQLTEGIVNTVVEPLVVLDSDLQVIRASRTFLQYFMVTTEQTIGNKIYDLGNGQWNIPSLRELLEEILPQRQTIEGFVVEHDFPELGKRRMVLNARRIKSSLGDTELILLAMVDIEIKDS